MSLGFDSLYPVKFLYQNDVDLIINQNPFYTQQGLLLNLVNALSGCRDETILNYSNIFLTKKVDINEVMTLASTNNKFINFPTYFALSAFPSTSSNTRYLELSTNPGLSSFAILTKSLSSTSNTYFIFSDLDGLHCRISTIEDNSTKNLTVNLTAGTGLDLYQCYFNIETLAISGAESNIFEYSLDANGYLKLFYRNGNKFYIIRNIGNTLSAVDVTLTSPLTTDIFLTTYKYDRKLNLKNDFIYYDKNGLKDFYVDDARTVSDVQQNLILYYNYQSQFNFVSGTDVLVDFFKAKNVLSNDYYVNDKLPFGIEDVVQREYSTILSKQNSELYNAGLQLNHTYYTKEYLLIPDVTTKFTLPETLYPYDVINVDDSNLVNAGAYGGLSPVFSDKLIKRLNPNINVVNYNEANGIYLYTWLYTDSQQLTSYWLDRYYYPKKTSLNTAYSGSNNQIFNYTSELSSFLNTNYAIDNYSYYDIRSSLTFEPSASYLYSRIGNNYINKVMDTINVAVSTVPLFTSDNVPIAETNQLNFDGNTYGVFKLTPDTNNSFTISFNINSEDVSCIKSNLIVGNNFDEGVSIYKGGVNNIFTPGYFVCSLSGINFFDINNNNTFTLNVSSYIKNPIKVLDVINYGFDHLIKVLYLDTVTNIPGLLEFSIYDKVFNVYQIPSLANVFNSGQRLNIFDKTYVGNNEVWYLIKSPTSVNTVYKLDYINNTYLGSINMPTGASGNYNSIVTFNNSVSTLSGLRGSIIDESYGISKYYNTVYIKNLSANTEFPVLCAEGGIFDILVFKDRYYIQTNGYVLEYDIYKRPYNVYYSSSNAVSGLKLDIINDNYNTKLLSYVADNNGNIIIDKFNLQTAEKESSYNTGIKVDPIYFDEFYSPFKAQYTTLQAIGIVNGNYVSGGVVNDYTYNTPLIASLTSFNVNAVIGGQSSNCGPTSILSGALILADNSNIPTDMYLSLYENSTILASVSSNGDVPLLTISYTGLNPTKSYSLVCERTGSDTTIVNMKLDIINGLFYNGSFRNVIVGSDKTGYSFGFANAFYASNNYGLTNQLGFVGTINSIVLDENYAPTANYSSNYNFNGFTTNNPLNNIYHAPNNPHLQLTVNPDITAFTPTLIQFSSNVNPPVSVLSGAPFQVPTNLTEINNVNRFDEGEFIARLDLFSGNNYSNKQTAIVPFDAENTSQIVMVLDVIDGSLKIYNNAELIENVPLSANTFYTSYFLGNNFGIGLPFINNRPASTIGINYNDYAQNYSINNFIVYDRPLNSDEIKFNFLKNKTIDAINFDVPQGTRNNLDTITSYNKFIAPGRKNNNIKLFIKNANLTKEGEALLTAQLINKLKNILPLNTSKVELQYINYE